MTTPTKPSSAKSGPSRSGPPKSGPPRSIPSKPEPQGAKAVRGIAAPDRADLFYQALCSRDTRFDGRFFTAVKTTGIYCRPICPARTPHRQNVEFYACAAAAEAAGFRPCLRCRPDAAPGSPEWHGTSSTVSRGLRLIAEGALDEGSVEELGARLGIGERHLHRLFVRHLGAPPVAVAQTHRVHVARRLLEETDSTATEIAFAAGFSSVRRFNTVFRRTFGATPRGLRERRRGKRPAPEGTLLHLTLRPRPPFDWSSIVSFLEPRCLPGVESIEGSVYRRNVTVDGRSGWIEVGPPEATKSRKQGQPAASEGSVASSRPNAESSRAGNTASGDRLLHPRAEIDIEADSSPRLELCTNLSPTRDLLRLVERVRDVLDLDVDTGGIGEALSRDERLAPLVRQHPGIRVPGAWNGFELAVRAILGQQVTVAGARTLAGRLVERTGGLTPEGVAGADLSSLGVPGKRAETLQLLARAVLDGRLSLEPWNDPNEAREAMLAIPGIGPWTAEYVAMRALRDPDAFPASDLGVRKALGRDGTPCSTKEAERRAEAWRPWRAYAVMLLWRSL